MPDLPIRMVNEDVDLLSRDPIQGHLTTSPEGPTSVSVRETLPPHAEVVKARPEVRASSRSRDNRRRSTEVISGHIDAFSGRAVGFAKAKRITRVQRSTEPNARV
jgi:hypothetical protein